MTTHVSTVKPYKGLGMEGTIARWYARHTGKALDDFKALARRFAAELPPDARVLEVAPGPGYFAIELAKLGPYGITGLDISQTFADIARHNAAKANVRVNFLRGNASHMPFPDESFDFLFCRAAFKNFTQPRQALDEMHRVLRPGGKAIIIDLKRDASNDSIAQAVDSMHLDPVNSLITKLTFRFMLLKRAYTKTEFEQLISETPFHHFAIREEPIGLEVSLFKQAAAPTPDPLLA